MVATSLFYWDENPSLSDAIKIGAFAESRKVSGPEVMMPDVPFSRLLRSTSIALSAPKSPPDLDQLNQQDTDNGNTQTQPPNDFILIDLKTPFAGNNGNNELSIFYRECQSAPPLQGCSENGTGADHIGDLTKKLEEFETNLKEYETVITEMCSCENNN